MTGATLVLFAVFVGLGRWQWGRFESKQRLWDAFARSDVPAEPLGRRATGELPRFAHVRVEGRWQPQRQFLLDNRTLDGRAGYEVLTPFALPSGRWLLVDRGWVPFDGFRDHLPEVKAGFDSTDTLGASIAGRLDELPVAALESSRAAPALQGPWPRLTNYPHPAELEAALRSDGAPFSALEPRLLLLDAGEPRGFERRWQPPGQPPATHWSYAVQWWSLAALLLGLYGVLNTKKKKRQNGST
ncbi:MAG: SURF1 family protein [Steroidobacteraceae bacterium]